MRSWQLRREIRRAIFIETQGLVTRSRFPRGPAADVQLQTYMSLPLSGWAVSIDF